MEVGRLDRSFQAGRGAGGRLWSAFQGLPFRSWTRAQ